MCELVSRQPHATGLSCRHIINNNFKQKYLKKAIYLPNVNIIMIPPYIFTC